MHQLPIVGSNETSIEAILWTNTNYFSQKERSANSVPIRSASLIHMEKNRPSKQLNLQLQAQHANEHRESPYEVRKRERGSEAKERGPKSHCIV